jgi:hypothetical protein
MLLIVPLNFLEKAIKIKMAQFPFRRRNLQSQNQRFWALSTFEQLLLGTRD